MGEIMTKQEKIKEIAKIICEESKGNICLFDKNSCDCKCSWAKDAEAIYNAVEKNVVKEFSEKLKKKLFDFFRDNEDLDGKISTGVLYVDIIGVEAEDGNIISLGLIDELLKEYEK